MAIQTILILIGSVLTTVSAQLLLKKGVLTLGNQEFSLVNFFAIIPKVFQNIWLLFGIFFFGISFFLWIFILSKMQLNIAYPIVISLNFTLITIGSWIFFKEYLSIIQILGIIVIIFGIFLVLYK
ncbi:MAG: transporter [Parcubacteria group bacterium]|nr:transporter [Parcubacteria group bacterium]